MRKEFLVTIAVSVIFMGCASSYHSMNLENMRSEKAYVDSLNEIDVISSPFSLSRNNTFHRRSILDKIELIGVAISNKSQNKIVVNCNDIVVKIGDEKLNILSVNKIESQNELTKPAWPYWFWSPVLLIINGIPLPFGLVTAVVNYSVAKSSNKAMLSDLNRYYNDTVPINPNSTSYMLLYVDFRGTRFIPYENELNIFLPVGGNIITVKKMK